ncbi:MAG: hypothetical protein GY795_49930 [Desulfobacterales bacterium]|nr:hypothetical protein [Desulfobacterales bacterium]
MKKSMVIPLIICVFMLSPANLCASSNKDHKGWWIEEYGELKENDYPLLKRVKEVFDKVQKVADKKYPPELAVLRKPEELLAICIKDGTVIVNKKVIDVCYAEKGHSLADARMAFIIGHELAHLDNDDFWYRETSDSLKRFDDIIPIPSTEAANIKQMKEFKADGLGMLYATMAGYDPKIIVTSKNNSFFHEWAENSGCSSYSLRSSPGKQNKASHPHPDDRAVVLFSKMKSVVEELDFFYIGVRLYQLGKYKDALVFLDKFKENFPCREVLNNIGLIHYQMAMKELILCDRKEAYQFKLPVLLDTETRAITMRSPDCGKDLFKDALKYFKKACEKDVFHIPAYVNYSSALIMKGEYTKAMAVAEDALKIEKDNPKILNNDAIAAYLSPRTRKEEAYSKMEYLVKKHPDFSDAYYNLGRIQAEYGNNSLKRELWKKYLELDTTGSIYAKLVRDSLKISKKSSEKASGFYERSPVLLGKIVDATKKKLNGLSELKLGTFNRYFYGGDIEVLILDNLVQVVEKTVFQNIPLADIIDRYGNAGKFFKSYSGAETYVYESFALDVQSGLVKKVIYFQ